CWAHPSGTMPMLDTAAMAQAILEHHAATFAGFAPEPTPEPTRSDAVYLASLSACSALGFIAHDAECLAQAWLAQSQRTGTFEAHAWPYNPIDFALQTLPRAQQFAGCPDRLG